VYRGNYRRARHRAIRQRNVVEVVVDDVEAVALLEDFGDVQAFPHLGDDGAVFLVATRHSRNQNKRQ